MSDSARSPDSPAGGPHTDPQDQVLEPAGADVPGSAAWWSERQARSARRRPRPDGLTIERIVDAAIRLVDAEGLSALTVRRLADDLGTGSASLYRHVASREELLVMMVDQVIGEVDLPDEHLPGRERVRILAHELRRVLLDHAQLLPALTAAPLLGPRAQQGSQLGVTSMLDAGFGPDDAVPAVLALIDFVLGTVYFDTSSAGRSFAAGQQAGDVTVPAVDDVFAFGLDTFMAGLDRRLADTDPR
jgi:AcrR family transcriptional regulator